MLQGCRIHLSCFCSVPSTLSSQSLTGQNASLYLQPQVSRPKSNESLGPSSSSSSLDKKTRRQAPDIPLPQVPPSNTTSQDDDDDEDAGVYEEMKSITLTGMQGPAAPIPTPRTKSNSEKDDYEGMEEST